MTLANTAGTAQTARGIAAVRCSTRMAPRLDKCASAAGPHRPRRDARIAVDAQVVLRRSGSSPYYVHVFDISRHGCKLEFVERPRLDEHVWVKFEALSAIEATVCWVEGHVVGVEFVIPVHPAVLDLLVQRLA